MSSTIGTDTPPWSAADEAEAARRLADALDNGASLQPISIAGVPLEPDEEAYADLEAWGWRYHALDVPYEQRTVMFGGPFLFAATGLASLMANRRRRREAERLAAPQWRALGHLRVVVTLSRLLIWHQGAWWSVWYSTITEVRLSQKLKTLDLAFASDSPYRLAGPGSCSLASLLKHTTGKRWSSIPCDSDGHVRP